MLTPNNFPLSTFRFPLDTLTYEHLDAYGITHPAQLLTLNLTAFFSSTSQILSHSTSQPFTIYPNPTIGIIHLPSQGVKAVAVFDMQGHK